MTLRMTTEHIISRGPTPSELRRTGCKYVLFEPRSQRQSKPGLKAKATGTVLELRLWPVERSISVKADDAPRATWAEGGSPAGEAEPPPSHLDGALSFLRSYEHMGVVPRRLREVRPPHLRQKQHRQRRRVPRDARAGGAAAAGLARAARQAPQNVRPASPGPLSGRVASCGFAARCTESWRRHRQPPGLLAAWALPPVGRVRRVRRSTYLPTYLLTYLRRCGGRKFRAVSPRVRRRRPACGCAGRDLGGLDGRWWWPLCSTGWRTGVEVSATEAAARGLSAGAGTPLFPRTHGPLRTLVRVDTHARRTLLPRSFCSRELY